MIKRRHFLQSLGAGMGISGLSLRQSWADELAPKRMVVINHNHGVTYDTWKIHPANMSTGHDWELNLTDLGPDEFSEALSPLYAHRNRMLMLDGLSQATAELDMDGFRHETGWIQSWTGNWVSMQSDGFSSSDGIGANSASLDQLVAAHVARRDRLPSIEIAVNGPAEEGRAMSFGLNGQRVPLEDSPQRLWDRLFGPSISPDPLLSRHQKALDFAFAEYSQIAPRLDTRDRQKMEAHFDLVHGLSSRLQGMAQLECGHIPELPDGILSYDQTFDTFVELIVTAFACDITRVATISLGCMPTSDFGWDHVTDDVHKGLAHEIYNDADCHQAMTDYLKMHAEQIGRLVSFLDSVPDVDGRSIMDNTMIVWGSELANGWHGYQHYCPVILGGDWHFRSGRYMHWAHQTPVEILVPEVISPSGKTQFSGLPHQHFLVSAAQAMGLDINRVGIDHVQSQRGDFVDCSGPLPNLV